ncbi:AAEL001430-PA [Aedes aegypti]|uniref:AAEL001430-PA n=1 Tax=Aedes aegypti TaxID=7159 RepID=Q17LB8_AEDAE|nr:AAEL001430-PA [Aedes aegypti]
MIWLGYPALTRKARVRFPYTSEMTGEEPRRLVSSHAKEKRCNAPALASSLNPSGKKNL